MACRAIEVSVICLLMTIASAEAQNSRLGSPDDLYKRGSAAYRSGDYANAIPDLEDAGEKGHPGAQALLAHLLWRGQHVHRDEARALALSMMAAENAPEDERMRIEDIYQGIFCASSRGTRQQAEGIVALRRTEPARSVRQDRNAGHRQGVTRACANGEIVVIRRALHAP